MSELVVEVVEIEEILPHGNADRLEIAKIKGWFCVTGKGNFKAGDRGIYFPIDSILPTELQAKLFPPDSKIKLKNGRIKTEKIRGVISQGLLIPLKDVGMEDLCVGVDVTKRLGIMKYEPDAGSLPNAMNPQQKRFSNPYFHKYTDIQNAKNYTKVFEEGEHVIAFEKIHGTNFRAGWVPYVPSSLWEKLKVRVLNFLNPAWVPQWEFVYGSRNMQLKKDSENLYARIVKQYDLENKIQHGHVIYGEIYGDGVQKGYNYGCSKDEQRLAIFDVALNGQYQDIGYVTAFCALKHLPVVPVVYNGLFDWDTMLKLTKGPSLINSTQKVREGIVVRSVKEESSPYIGRKVLKFVSDEYLLKDQTEFH